MNIRNYFPNKYPVAEGKTRFVVKYEGFGVTFSTDIDGVDELSAKDYFSRHYPSAKFISIKKK